MIGKSGTRRYICSGNRRSDDGFGKWVVTAHDLNRNAMRVLTRQKVDRLRGELFHMILFSLAWVLIGEQVFNFRDYAAGAAVILAVVVWLALYSEKLYELEDKLPPEGSVVKRKEIRRDQLFAWILFFEGAALS